MHNHMIFQLNKNLVKQGLQPIPKYRVGSTPFIKMVSCVDASADISHTDADATSYTMIAYPPQLEEYGLLFFRFEPTKNLKLNVPMTNGTVL